MTSQLPNIILLTPTSPSNGPMFKTADTRSGVKSTSRWGSKNIGGISHKKYQEIFKLNSPVISL